MKKGNPRLLHTEAAALFHDKPGLAALAGRLGYRFADSRLLETALIHPSCQKQGSNQRLEFLGDAVLQLVISRALYERGKDAEGKLTFKRQKLVNEKALAGIARGIGLGEHLKVSASFALEGGAGQDSILSDAMEAVLAAVYLDGGMEAASDVVLRLWEGLIAAADSGLDAKGALQSWLQARGEAEPVYQLVSEDGPPHRRRFQVAVFSRGQSIASGSGRTKKAAEQQAAELALESLKRGHSLEAEQD